ncbi:MAG TPA: MarR family transcriptional regulator [Pseudonocardiaceae bacterium]|nr:MarR family transcriptional regulator [Pseudonocardiaceae bacterium]
MRTEDDSRLRELVRFADDVGLFYEDLGLTRIWGRVVGWLMVCEPDYQSAEDLATVLHASRGSISTTTRSLVRAGLVERQNRPGDRRTYYRINPGAWTAVFEHQIQTTKRLRGLAQQGLAALDGEPSQRRRRLSELEDLTVFYEREAPALLERWHQQHYQNPSGGPGVSGTSKFS